jgi:hypothetical protein
MPCASAGPNSGPFLPIALEAHRLGLVRRAERKYSEADTGGLENNAAISGEG